MKRRTFLASAAAVAALPTPLRASSPRTLTAAPSAVRIAPPEYPETQIWAYDQTSPGTELRVPQGADLHRRLINNLDTPTSVHWHGIRLNNAMDGVPGLTQQAVMPGADFDYRFRCPDAGTFWYHSHLKSNEQIERGLYGPLIVEEPQPLDIDADHVLMIDDWRLDQTAQIIGDFQNGHDLSHGGRLGNVVTCNGAMELRLTGRRGDRLRLRLINAANARVFTLALHGMRGWIVATDGMPVSQPRLVDDTFLLAPAQRLDLIVDITDSEEATLLDVVGEDSFALASFAVSGSGSPRQSPPAPLPPNPNSTPADQADARQLVVKMQGGAMAWLDSANSPAGEKSGRDLAADGLFWALNDYAGRPEAPLAELSVGEPAIIEFVNDTMWPHAMHLHGQHFFELDATSTPGDFRDTTLVHRGETRRVLLTADNPGDWLLHCHMLGHHAAGMGTWIKVS